MKHLGVFFLFYKNTIDFFWKTQCTLHSVLKNLKNTTAVMNMSQGWNQCYIDFIIVSSICWIYSHFILGNLKKIQKMLSFSLWTKTTSQLEYATSYNCTIFFGFAIFHIDAEFDFKEYGLPIYIYYLAPF